MCLGIFSLGSLGVVGAFEGLCCCLEQLVGLCVQFVDLWISAFFTLAWALGGLYGTTG